MIQINFMPRSFVIDCTRALQSMYSMCIVSRLTQM
jgi:hypothetical protein